MNVIWGFDEVPTLRYGVATVGSYDGVHCGHRILLNEVVARAKRCGGESVVVTFEPHPRITLGNDQGLKLLTTFEEKCVLLEALGVDYVVVIPFDKQFSQLSHDTFVDEYLVGKLGVKELVVGYNHHFGRNKEGDRTSLLRHGALQIVEIAQYTDNGNKVSSTVIRGRLRAGDTATATQLLGYRYMIVGKADNEGVVTIDEYKLLPTAGRYACTVNGVDSECEVREGAVKQSLYSSQKIEILL